MVKHNNQFDIFNWSLCFGVAFPAGYYLCRLFLGSFSEWTLPAHSILRQLMVTIVLIVLAVVLLRIDRNRSQRTSRDDPVTSASADRTRVLWMTALLLGVGLVLYFFPYQYMTHYGEPKEIGDAMKWVLTVADPYLFASEPLGRWAQYLTWQALSWLKLEDAIRAVRLSSVAAGLFYLGAVILLSRHALPKLSTGPVALFLFLAPTSILYFGFPETTPWAYAFAGTYLLAGLVYLNRAPARGPWLESFLLMVAVAAHGQMCFITGGHLALVGVWLKRSGIHKPVFATAWIASANICIPFALLLVLVMLSRMDVLQREGWEWYGHIRGGADERLWVRLFSRDYLHEYLLFGRRHVSDLAHLMLAACPLIFLGPRALFDLKKTNREISTFLGLGLGGLIFLAVAWNADWGIPRDYDLMAAFALPAQVIMLVWWSQRMESVHTVHRLLIIISFVSLVCYLLPFLKDLNQPDSLALLLDRFKPG
jgi:hypothetical protein